MGMKALALALALATRPWGCAAAWGCAGLGCGAASPASLRLVPAAATARRVVHPPVCFIELHALGATYPQDLREEAPRFRVGLLSESDVSGVAGLLVECFYGPQMKKQDDPSSGAAPSASPAEAGAATKIGTPPPPPMFARKRRQPLGAKPDAVPPRLVGASLALQERWRTASRGLQWRLSERLRRPSVALSLESSLLLALQERRTGQLVGCVEVSLRPVDGKLPGEFAVPPLFLSHSHEELGAYLSNLAVLPEYRRGGLARRLLCVAEWLVRSEWGMDAMYLHVDMNNAAAVRLYESLGYQPLPAFDTACLPPRTCFAALTGAPTPRNRFHRKLLVAAPPLREVTPSAQGTTPVVAGAVPVPANALHPQYGPNMLGEPNGVAGRGVLV